MTDPKEQARQKVAELVQRFEANLPDYRSGRYNETQVRRDFIDPLFVALGWDIDNQRGLPESQREVVHEDRVQVGNQNKAPDYGFRIGGERQFFVEAKKPSVNISQDVTPAFQVRRYAWSAKLPVSILTDFEEFAIYDGRVQPKKDDHAKVARLHHFTFRDYLDRWDEIYDLFSREAVMSGSLERFTEDKRGRKGQTTVDAAFLQEIEEWRELLARNIALRNENLTQRELNFAVQLTIDRIIFLRICEDRGIEPYETLKQAASVRDNVYGELLRLFRLADARYNSGLFHFSQERGRAGYPDELTPSLILDDETLQKIIRRLYYPVSPYAFSVMPAEILGQVYEQFLGKVIRLTAGHRAKVEEKPEVKKAGGVYYTPAYIVDYIVKQTVGKLVEGKTPSEAAKLRILDPACGSGSFLIGAYQYLLDWHLDWYTANHPAKHKKAVYQTDGGDWKLTIEERRRILLNNLYGVDIDAQAVEVTKLSLLLKVLEGESEASVGRTLQMFKERALPDLDKNIQCGNSLIGYDFYDNIQKGLWELDEEERYRVNVFDWEEAFPDIMRDGGFDAVIGNPPYVRQETLGQDFKRYAQRTYRTYASTADLYVYFIEKGVGLLKEGGVYSVIVANKWMRASYGKPLRQWMKTQYIEEITDFGDLPVFKQATTYPCILRISKGKPSEKFWGTQIATLDFPSLEKYVTDNRFSVSLSALDDNGWSLVADNAQSLIKKLQATGITLEKYVNGGIYYGIKTGLNEAFVVDKETRDRLIAQDPKCSQFIKPFLAGRDIKRYESPYSQRFLILIPNGWTNQYLPKGQDAWRWFAKEYPSLAQHLTQFEDAARKRYDQGEYWWELRPCDYYTQFEQSKLMLPDISIKGNFILDTTGSYCVNTAYIIGNSDIYLLGILNSRLITFYYGSLSPAYRGGYLRFIYQYLTQLPIRTIDFTNPAEVAQHDRMVKLVETMLELHRQLAAAKTDRDRDPIQRQIAATDRQIDALVYELYGLTEEEIAIVEG